MLQSRSDHDGPAGTGAPGRARTRLNFGWIMPPFVRELPVDAADDETAAEKLYALTTELLADRPLAEQYRFALALSSQLEPMQEANVIYAGLCLLEAEGRASGSTILVSQVPHEEDEGEVLRTTREALELRHPDDDYQVVELPCGPALTRIGTSDFVISAEWSPTQQEVLVRQSQIQVYIPLPGTGELLIFALDSPTPEAWDLHSELFAEILKTIDWGTDQEIEDYRSIQQGTQTPAIEPDPAVRQRLFWHSSRLLDAVALRARMVGGEQTTSVTCEACWSKGLRSACSARHGWRLEGVTPADLAPALSRIDTTFSSQGWHVAPANNGAGLRAQAGETAAEQSTGYLFTLAVDTVSGTISIEVSSPCERISAASDSVFG